MQTKVADLYLKLGRNQEALEIYFNSAQSLYQRGAIENAEEALERVHKLDAKFAPALLLRGQIAMETGKGERAIESLAKLPDLDSRPEALRPLLQAYVKAGDLEKADPIATKLIEVHNDLSAIPLYAEALFNAQKPEKAMSIYERNADKLLADNRQVLLDALNAAMSKARESAPALESMLTLLKKAGVSDHLPREVQESLAHAYVQGGELQKAADLYKELAESEPENPLHDQNYKQVIARLGKDSATRELTVEEGGQALMVDELESAPAVMQEYPRELAEAINSALTDSELFSSYNVPEKAIGPLEKILPQAPNDVRLRQRLASLYARAGRLANAAECCTILADVHAAAGHTDPALQFREMAAKYLEQAGAAPSAAPAEIATHSSEVQEIVRSETPASSFHASSIRELSIEPPADQQPSVAEFDLTTVPADASIEVPAESPPPAPVEAEAGNEWEDMLTVEEPTPAGEEAGSTQFIGERQMEEISAEETPEEILEEARFYLSQAMNSEAQSAIARLQRVAPDHPALDELRQLAGVEQVATEAASAMEEPVAELEVQPSVPTLEPESLSALEIDIAAATPPIEIEEIPVVEQATSVPSAREHVAAHDDVLGDLDVEETPHELVLDELMPEAPHSVRTVLPSAPARAVPHAPAASDNPLAGMLSDIEEALGDIAPPAAKPATSIPQPVAAAAPQKSAPALAQVSVQVESGEAQSMLSDLLDEFKEEIEEPAEDADDPDTHYNLGVAFREMGLLDEAIGELQKVCRALDSGKPFTQPIQAYTWLAQCLVDKGAAQAAIRWYERALQVQGISEDSRLAVHYDIANAFESAGNKKAALDNFMEVYGLNIDYRDVADRIRSLRK
jgi:tetratricopeptide (TPR) repeat protein